MSRARNPRGEGGRLRDEIVAAGVALVDETGAALTLRGVARRAGISAPSVYDHFRDLDEVVDAVIASSFDELREQLASAVGPHSDADPEAALVAAATAYVRFGWDHRPRYRLMFAADGYAPNAIEAFGLVRSLVEACVEAGLSDSTDTRLDTWMVWAGLHGVATLEKPARADRRRLGPLDRVAMLETMVHRLARLTTSPR